MIPALGVLLAKVGLPALISVVGGALGAIDHPVAKTASKALGDVGEAVKANEITPEQIAEGHRHIEAMDKNASDEWRESTREVNATIRAETQSEDQYVRRWRPTWGYVTAYCWAAQTGMICLGILVACLAALFGHGDISMTILRGLTDLIEAMTMQWSVALAVLGVSVVQRSRDKTVKSGAVPPTLFGTLASRFTGKD